ncbi:MAG: hypothetical protein J7J06_07790 [Methanosarcinales archaeon]|nr:hypothetical protein [Methanosarcinales archaeon]
MCQKSIYIEGIDERKDAVGVGMRLFDMFLEMDLDVPLRIARAKEGVGEVVVLAAGRVSVSVE